jgi:16S rRNA processing protein RimM
MVRLETDRPDAVFTPGRVLRLGNPQGRLVEGTLTVERSRPFKAGVLLKTREHGGRSEAQDALRGATLLMERSEAAPLDDDEVFYHELVGMRVTAAGEAVGVVRGWYESPAGFLLEVRAAGGRDLLIPFVRSMVTRVDRAGRVLEIEAPAGLLDL